MYFCLRPCQDSLQRCYNWELLFLLENWLPGCYSCVKWHSAWSVFIKLDIGVRQGSVLSPLLFALYVDDIAVFFGLVSDLCNIFETTAPESFLGLKIAFQGHSRSSKMVWFERESTTSYSVVTSALYLIPFLYIGLTRYWLKLRIFPTPVYLGIHLKFWNAKI